MSIGEQERIFILMIYTDMYSLVHEARTVRSFDMSRKADRTLLEELVDTARVAPSARNMQPLKYKLCCAEDEIKGITERTRWGGSTPEKRLPPEDREPSGFIVICHDKSVCEKNDFSTMDVGIAAQTINLAAREKGYGCCMLGAFDHDSVADFLLLPRTCEPVLIIAVGTPAESPVICSVGEDGGIGYFKDDAGLHFVPKRSLKDIIL